MRDIGNGDDDMQKSSQAHPQEAFHIHGPDILGHDIPVKTSRSMLCLVLICSLVGVQKGGEWCYPGYWISDLEPLCLVRSPFLLSCTTSLPSPTRPLVVLGDPFLVYDFGKGRCKE